MRLRKLFGVCAELVLLLCLLVRSANAQIYQWHLIQAGQCNFAVRLTGPTPTDPPAIFRAYGPGGEEIVHTARMSVAPATNGTWNYPGQFFALAQFRPYAGKTVTLKMERPPDSGNIVAQADFFVDPACHGQQPPTATPQVSITPTTSATPGGPTPPVAQTPTPTASPTPPSGSVTPVSPTPTSAGPSVTPPITLSLTPEVPGVPSVTPTRTSPPQTGETPPAATETPTVTKTSKPPSEEESPPGGDTPAPPESAPPGQTPPQEVPPSEVPSASPSPVPTASGPCSPYPCLPTTGAVVTDPSLAMDLVGFIFLVIGLVALMEKYIRRK